MIAVQTPLKGNRSERSITMTQDTSYQLYLNQSNSCSLTTDSSGNPYWDSLSCREERMRSLASSRLQLYSHTSVHGGQQPLSEGPCCGGEHVCVWAAEVNHSRPVWDDAGCCGAMPKSCERARRTAPQAINKRQQMCKPVWRCGNA